ncbi:MAG: hypothetical protein Q9227_000976 [Pyrenula ochraceoflavens]
MLSSSIVTVLLASFASLVVGASLQSTVDNNPDLKSLSYYLNLYPDLLSRLNSAQNITFLAPSNDAIQSALGDQKSQYSQAKIYGWIDQIIEYHTLNGSLPSSHIIEAAHFKKSWLNDSTWTSVSGGQVVGYVLQNNTPVFQSGVKTVTNIKQADITFDNGIMHILDSVLEIPLNTTGTCYALDMPDAASTLDSKKFHVGLDTAFPDMTLFIPPEQGIEQFAGYINNVPDSEFQEMMGYHLVVGEIMYSCEAKNESLITYTPNNEPVQITVVGEDIFVNSARVIEKDIIINSGVAHLLDQPLNPKNKSSLPSFPPIPNSAPSTSNTTNSTTASSSTTPTPDHSSSTLSPGAIAGISLSASLVSLSLIALLIFFFIRRCRLEQHRQSPPSRSYSSSSSGFGSGGIVERSSHEVLRKGNPRVKARKGVFKPLPEKPVEVSGGEVARELSGSGSSSAASNYSSGGSGSLGAGPGGYYYYSYKGRGGSHSVSPVSGHAGQMYYTGGLGNSNEGSEEEGWAELDSKSLGIMAGIPQDVYEVWGGDGGAAELEGDEGRLGDKEGRERERERERFR